MSNYLIKPVVIEDLSVPNRALGPSHSTEDKTFIFPKLRDEEWGRGLTAAMKKMEWNEREIGRTREDLLHMRGECLVHSSAERILSISST